MHYITGKEARILDLNATYLGVSKAELMENAGKAVYEEILKIQGSRKKKIAVYCGQGNNGGDGLVCGRYLHEAGYNVDVFIAGQPTTPEASDNLRLLRDRLAVYDVTESRYDSDIIVDALLGTGMRGRVREPIKRIIKRINASRAYKISVDVPSGLDESGRGYCVNADKVITFHGPKRGLERFKAVVRDIGIPVRAATNVGPGDLVLNLTRQADSHKGDNGRVLVIGGSDEYHGAPILSAQGALHSGVDLVHVAVPESNYDITRNYGPDFIVKKFPGDFLGSEGLWYPEGRYDSMVIGPGLGTRTETKEAIMGIIKRTKIPVVVDADAIKAIAGTKISLRGVLTPHSKEFEILSGKKLAKANKKRRNMLLEEAAKRGSVILLKAPMDIIVAPDGRWKFNDTGNPGMTVGGTGDVLAGLVAGLIAQGMDLFTAACCGAFINGTAGDELYTSMGYCFTASDLAYEIPYTMKRLLEYGS